MRKIWDIVLIILLALILLRLFPKIVPDNVQAPKVQVIEVSPPVMEVPESEPELELDAPVVTQAPLPDYSSVVESIQATTQAKNPEPTQGMLKMMKKDPNVWKKATPEPND